MNEPIKNSYKYKEEYLRGLRELIDRRRTECDKARAEYISPEKVAADREKYRADFVCLLGWPLTDYEALKDAPMTVKKELRHEDEHSRAYSMQFEVLPELWFYGIYLENKRDGGHPFVICQHGGGGSPEYVAGFYGDSIYHGMAERALTHGGGANVFCPGLLIWDRAEEAGNPPFDRVGIDNALKHTGGSIQSLEVFAIRRVLDYFMGEGVATHGHIGMIGLSYGGLYTLVMTAVECRISAAYSSCHFNERYKYLWCDWTWKDASSRFLDAEIASLIAPRALFLEAGMTDHLFSPNSFEREATRAAEFFAAAGAEGKINYRITDCGHEFASDNAGLDFIFSFIE